MTPTNDGSSPKHAVPFSQRPHDPLAGRPLWFVWLIENVKPVATAAQATKAPINRPLLSVQPVP